MHDILISVECDYLTVEQYASMLGIEPVTDRQWIRRGKLRYAKKVGRDWLIPNIEDKPRRGFTRVQYIVEKEARIESNEFPLLSACDLISILQDQDNSFGDHHSYFLELKSNLLFSIT